MVIFSFLTWYYRKLCMQWFSLCQLIQSFILCSCTAMVMNIKIFRKYRKYKQNIYNRQNTIKPHPNQVWQYFISFHWRLKGWVVIPILSRIPRKTVCPNTQYVKCSMLKVPGYGICSVLIIIMTMLIYGAPFKINTTMCFTGKTSKSKQKQTIKA